jgi:NTE family protein
VAPFEVASDATLVLGGGGITGIAWEIGLIAGLRDAGIDLTTASAFLGTSAGSTVVAQITSGVDIEELYQQQLAGVPHELSRSLGAAGLVKFVVGQLLPGDDSAAGRRIGKYALNAKVGPYSERRAIIESRLPVHAWPDADVRIVVLDAESGEERVITRADGIDLVDTVAASCAVPMVWPPVKIGDRTYIDGGILSPLNLDRTPGTGPVIALAPISASIRRSGSIERQQKALAPRPVHVVSMSAEAKIAQGKNTLDKAAVPGTARAGREQAKKESERLSEALRTAS